MNPDKYKHIDDRQLLQYFYTDKNNEWLGILLERYTLLLLGVCMKYLKNGEEAKDSVQQIFLKVIAELHRYKVDHFKSWLYTVAKNHCLMKLRNKGNAFTEMNETLLVVTEEAIPEENYNEKDKIFSDLEEAIAQLNNEQRESVTLFYLEKKSYQEIAELTGHTLLQVKSYIQNGKRNLKIMLKHLHQNER